MVATVAAMQINPLLEAYNANLDLQYKQILSELYDYKPDLTKHIHRESNVTF